MQLTNVDRLIFANQYQILKALLLGLILQTFMANNAAAQFTATRQTVLGSYRLEAFGGYSYLHFDSGLSSTQGVPFVASTTSMGMNGWTIAGTYNVTNYFGATAEFSGQYVGDFFGVNASFANRPFRTHVYNFLFGPTLTYRKNRKITPFAHVLVGDSHGAILTEGPAFRVTRDALALAAGGGVDYKMGDRLVVRLAQFDYIHTGFDFNNDIYNVSGLPTSQNHFRYSAGIVIKAFLSSYTILPPRELRGVPHTPIFDAKRLKWALKRSSNPLPKGTASAVPQQPAKCTQKPSNHHNSPRIL